MILVCLSEGPDGQPDCGGRNPKEIADALKRAVEAAGLKDRIRVTKTTCLGNCEQGPNVMVFPEGILLSGVRPDDVPAIVETYVKAGRK